MANSVEEFWKTVVEFGSVENTKEDEDGCYDYSKLVAFLEDDKNVEFLKSSCPDDIGTGVLATGSATTVAGFTIPEYLCSRDRPGKVVADYFQKMCAKDEMKEAKLPATERCYDLLMKEDLFLVMGFLKEMLRTMSLSGCLPQFILDTVCDYLDRMWEEGEGEFDGGEIRETVANFEAQVTLQEGVTHKIGGAYLGYMAICAEEEEDIRESEEREKKRKEREQATTKAEPEPEPAAKKPKKLDKASPVSVVEPPHKTPKQDKASPVSVLEPPPTKPKQDTTDGLVCPVCKTKFSTAEDKDRHLANSPGKAHKKYRNNGYKKPEKKGQEKGFKIPRGPLATKREDVAPYHY